MPQTPSFPDRPSNLAYDQTLILAIELSNKTWVLAAQVPGLPHAKAKRTIEPTPEALMAAIAGYRTRAASAGRTVERVIATYEAGWSGQYRTLGLGYANIGGLLMTMGLPYDSGAGRALCGALTAIMTGVAYATSAEMAGELGTFPQYKKNAQAVTA